MAIENAQLYEELREKDQRKDEFLAMLAHELRNPLAAIRNAVALGSGEEANAEEIEWSMEVINRQMRQLSRLIDDLLDVSRITQGKVQLRREPLDAARVLQSALDTVQPLMEERQHELTVSFRPGSLHLEADPTRLEQIIVNLLANAARYTEKGGEISLRAKVEEDQVVIRIKDNGRGIPPEKLPRMFDLFTQGERTLARSEGGLGIGLTIVRSLVELHGGNVTAHSEGVGQGSEFVVRLPVSAGAPAVPAAQSGGTRAVASASKPLLGAAAVAHRILIVDDNADSAHGTAKILTRRGHDVRIVYDGPGALTAAREHRPRYVLLDIGLPGMDGYEVAARLRREDVLKGATLIAVSGYGQDSDRRRSREAGFRPAPRQAGRSRRTAGAFGVRSIVGLAACRSLPMASNRAALPGFLGVGKFLRGGGLVMHAVVAVVHRKAECCRSDVFAQPATDALVMHVPGARDIVGKDAPGIDGHADTMSRLFPCGKFINHIYSCKICMSLEVIRPWMFTDCISFGW